MRAVLFGLALAAVVGVPSLAAAQTTPPSQAPQPPSTLTLAEAIQRALANHPSVLAAEDVAKAAAAATAESKSTRYPTVFGSVTAVDALANSRIAAGGLNNPIIFDRYSNGVALSQLVTDFGRSGNLVDSATLHQQAREKDVDAVRADVQLQVTAAYLGARRAQAVLQVTDDTVAARQLVVNQITALAQNQLKSDLDVSFATVNLSQAQLLQLQARDDVQARFADLAAAMGERDQAIYTLADPEDAGPTPPVVPDLDPLLSGAMSARPDLVSVRADFTAAQHFAAAQGALSRPAISFAAAAGVTPSHQDTLTDRYAAAGINVNIPIFNGHLFGAEHAEAAARADAESERVRDTENRIAHDIRVAWLQAGAAFQRIALTGQLVTQATRAQGLAQSRYDLGLSSIVELSEAQLNATEARLQEANARYAYAAALAILRYQAGQRP
jgi:outer membrane protein